MRTLPPATGPRIIAVTPCLNTFGPDGVFTVTVGLGVVSDDSIRSTFLKYVPSSPPGLIPIKANWVAMYFAAISCPRVPASRPSSKSSARNATCALKRSGLNSGSAGAAAAVATSAIVRTVALNMVLLTRSGFFHTRLSLPSVGCGTYSGIAQVLHEDDLVAFFVVDQLVNAVADHQQTEPTWPDSFLLPHLRVRNGILRGLTDGRVRQLVHLETLTGIRDAVKEHSRRAQTCDANLPLGIQLAAPLDRIQQKLTKRVADGVAKLRGQRRIELRHHTLDPFGSFSRARNHQLDPLGARRDHFDWRQIVSGQDLANGVQERDRLDRFVHVLECLFADRLEQRLRRFIRRHDHHSRAGLRGAQFPQHLEPVHARHPHIQKQQIESFALERLQSVDAVLRNSGGEAGTGEDFPQDMPGRLVVVDDENPLHDRPRFLRVSGGRVRLARRTAACRANPAAVSAVSSSRTTSFR